MRALSVVGLGAIVRVQPADRFVGKRELCLDEGARCAALELNSDVCWMDSSDEIADRIGNGLDQSLGGFGCLARDELGVKNPLQEERRQNT